MIFQHTLTNILLENKTQTRRVIKSDEVAVRGQYNKIVSVYNNGRTKWSVGSDYSVQPGRGKSAVARIRITKINSEQILRISNQAAIAEGFCSRQEFLKTWKHIHGEQSFGLRVWVLTFELIEYTNITELTIHQDYSKIFAYASRRFDYTGTRMS